MHRWHADMKSNLLPKPDGFLCFCIFDVDIFFSVVKFQDLNKFVKEKTKNVECHVLYCGLDLRYFPEEYMKIKGRKKTYKRCFCSQTKCENKPSTC